MTLSSKVCNKMLRLVTQCSHSTSEFGGLSRKVGAEVVSYGGSAHDMHSFFSIARIIKSKQHLSLWKGIRSCTTLPTQSKARPYDIAIKIDAAALSTFS